jgi:hypothetical protein
MLHLSILITFVLHYYRLTFHRRHFHYRSDRSDGVILPPPIRPIAMPPRQGNWQLKTINAAVVAGLNSTVVWNIEPTRIRVMAVGPTRPFGVLAVVNSA